MRVASAPQRCPSSPHVRRLVSAMLSVVATRAAARVRNVVSGRHTCGGSPPQCCQWSPHVLRLVAAMLSVVATRVAARVRNVVRDRHTCGGWCPQCCPWSPHVWRLVSAMLFVIATRVAAGVRNVVSGRHTCGGSSPQCCQWSPHVWRLVSAMLSVVAARASPSRCNADARARKRPGTLHFGVSRHFPLIFPGNPGQVERRKRRKARLPPCDRPALTRSFDWRNAGRQRHAE
jgi:hypothetical protein